MLKIFFTETIIALLMVLGFRIATQPSSQQASYVSRQEVYKSRFIMSCSPDWYSISPDSLAKTITPLPGWGNYRWDITTSSDSARFYFNQGINMYYAFHIIESMASFKKAQLFDDSNAMLYWAEALAYGPNINDIEYAATPGALQAAQKAIALSANCSTREKALINAMQVRYTDDSTISRTSLNLAYATAMEHVYRENELDADLATLYADALLVQHPWDYWKHNGEAQPWTPKILEVLEKVIAFAPEHPGANHYYIHAVEASTNPGKALPSADRLGKLMPSVSHMVHMPSHIYIRTGNYREGVKVNEMSVTGYEKYLQLYPDVVNNSPLYLIHNLHMKAACAMMQPNYASAKKTALECVSSFDTSFLSMAQPMGNFIQYVFTTPQMVDVRYGKWAEILNYPDITANYPYGYVLSQWSKGLAYANTGKVAHAKQSLQQMQQGMLNTDLKIVFSPF